MNIYSLIKHLAQREQQITQARFLAPWVEGRQIGLRLEGLLYLLRPLPKTEPGWSYFQPINAKQAVRVAAATLADVASYLRRCVAHPLHLALRLKQQTWLAMPQDARRTEHLTGVQGPVLVHLVERSQRFDTIMGRFDGASWWYEARDRRSDPWLAERLRSTHEQRIPAEQVRIRGLTPALRMAYSLVHERHQHTQTQRDTQRLQQALAVAGGTLAAQHDRGDHWLVTWRTPDGERHTSAVSKDQLTILSAGICLSDQDKHFDLQSLVSVMQQRPNWMRA